jgi:dienelactone hydrolase
MAYEMGRHIIGYEVQKARAAVTWLKQENKHVPVAVYGYGEGGLVALYSAALDERIDVTAVSGYFGPREQLWREPIYRNVFGLLREFGDAELARLIAPRFLLVDAGTGPTVEGPPAPHAGRGGAAPGRLEPIPVSQAQQEAKRAAAYYEQVKGLADGPRLVVAEPGKDSLLQRVLKSLNIEPGRSGGEGPGQDQRRGFDPAARQKRQLDQLVAFTQQLLTSSERWRQRNVWDRLDTSSVEKYQKSCIPLRQQLWEEVIGKLPALTLPSSPKSRLLYDTAKWRGYEVTLDLYPDVFAYGILLVPHNLKPGEKRPVVVCQHGLEGRPSDVCNPKQRTPYYNSFGAQLADRGYIVYAPQNPYIGQDRFRVLQRKANPLGLSLFSFIIAQHGLTLDWLASLPFVDADRMAFYGLSYGGKTAMRVPAVLPRYCLSICSGDFNEWIRKNVSLDYPSSYMFSPEYEMPEFNLGHTFNYAEMAALIAPRPFMVERGHDDGVGVDEWVAYEYARVRRLYSRLKMPQATAIEFFAGGHEVRGQGTFRFLDEHLHWHP